MAAKGDLAKARAMRLKPGAKLMREWRGETHDVVVLADGFSWRGEHWRGDHWRGRGHWYRGRWWGYGEGPCWRRTAVGWVWICD